MSFVVSVLFSQNLFQEIQRPRIIHLSQPEDWLFAYNRIFVRSCHIDQAGHRVGIMHLAQLFAEACAGGEPKSRLYGDTLSVALLLALSRLDPLKDRSSRAGQLAPWQIRRVTEYLAAHLSDDIQLQTVSDLVKLSRSYFSRAFKISTGHAPHQWLLQARIAKAKELLVEGDLPLAQIAVDIGFADQAHFTRTFGRVVGQTPRTWQRARCA